MKLDARDRQVLQRLEGGPRTAAALASDLGARPHDLDRRLSALADNDLVTILGDGRVRRTESGRRVVATSAGARDNQVDTTPAVERALARFRLGPEEAEAVRGAFAFLRYWGRATDDELIDAIYSEDPAGHPTGDAWWTHLVRDPLAALPGVVPPRRPGEPWRYAGPPEADTPGADGTRRLARPGRRPYGSVKHALESLPLAPAEREAVRAAFAFLRAHGEASERAVAAAVYADHPAGYPTPDAWWDGLVRDAFGRLPGVYRVRDDVWRYRQPTARTRPRSRPDGDGRA